MSVGEKMAKLRKEKSLGQQAVAEALNLSVSTVSNYEKNSHAPDLLTLIKIADFYDVTVDYLLDRTDFRVNSDILSKKFTDNLTYAKVFRKLKSLSKLDKLHLLSYLDYLIQQNKRKLQ